MEIIPPPSPYQQQKYPRPEILFGFNSTSSPAKTGLNSPAPDREIIKTRGIRRRS